MDAQAQALILAQQRRIAKLEADVPLRCRVRFRCWDIDTFAHRDFTLGDWVEYSVNQEEFHRLCIAFNCGVSNNGERTQYPLDTLVFFMEDLVDCREYQRGNFDHIPTQLELLTFFIAEYCAWGSDFALNNTYSSTITTKIRAYMKSIAEFRREYGHWVFQESLDIEFFA